MRNLFLIFVNFTTFLTLTYSQTLVPSEILRNVFLIKFNSNTATSFLVSIDSSDFLITAKHLFPDSLPTKSHIEIEVFKNAGWEKLSIKLLLHYNRNIDIAVLDLGTNLLKKLSFDIGGENFYLSQECFFLGYPFGLKLDDIDGSINRGFPLPFVKRAIISSFITDSSHIQLIFLDGHNNPGFSGGPVVIKNLDKGSTNKMRIIGIVSAYIDEPKIIETQFGKIINRENSGIVISYGFDPVFEIVKNR